MRDGERKREIRDRENNLFERIWDVAKGEKPDFWKKWVKGHSENRKTNINHCSLRFCHESIPRLFCFRTTLLKIQVPVSRAQLFTLAHHPLPSSRESWAPSFQAQSWLRPAGQSIRKIQETSSRRMNYRSWTNRNNRCSISLWSHSLSFTHPFTSESMTVSSMPDMNIYPWCEFRKESEM